MSTPSSGDLAQKSHCYVSGLGADRIHRMVVCSVLFGDALQLEGHLASGEAMHDVFSLRALGPDVLPKMVTSVGAEGGRTRRAGLALCLGICDRCPQRLAHPKGGSTRAAQLALSKRR